MDRVVLRRLESKRKPTLTPDNNLLRLKRISQSFEDLTSETLYSKWKRARKNSGAKTDRRERSNSLILLPEEELDGNGRRRTSHSSAATLQRQIFRPRGWSVCSSELSRDNEKNVLPEEAIDVSGNDAKMMRDSSVDTLQRELFNRERSWTVCSGELSRHYIKGGANISDSPKDCLSERSLSPTEADGLTSSPSSENLHDGDDVFATTITKSEQHDTIESRKSKIITEIIAGTTQNDVRKVRSLSDGDRRYSEVRSTRCRLISDPILNSARHARSQSCREPREIEFLRTAERVQRYLDHNKMAQEDIWQKRRYSEGSVVEGRHKRMPRSSVIRARSEVNNNACNIQEASLGFPNDRSQPDAGKRYVLGCTYALIRQPEPQVTQTANQQDFADKLIRESLDEIPYFLSRTMSGPRQGLGKKESRSTEEKERDDRTVKFKDVDESDSKGSHQEGSHGVKRAQTLPRMPKRPLSSLTSKSWKESELRTRKGAEDLIQNINNSNEKSAQERVDIVEKAFEWIRKEVADLRAQDKDIMRMFTKIQAGIRHIKFDQSALMEETEEEFISTPDLSQSPDGHGGTVQRRASLL